MLYIIMIVLLYYILLLPSFYYSLGHFLMTLSLRAQVGAQRFCNTRYFLKYYLETVTFSDS